MLVKAPQGNCASRAEQGRRRLPRPLYGVERSLRSYDRKDAELKVGRGWMNFERLLLVIHPVFAVFFDSLIILWPDDVCSPAVGRFAAVFAKAVLHDQFSKSTQQQDHKKVFQSARTYLHDLLQQNHLNTKNSETTFMAILIKQQVTTNID